MTANTIDTILKNIKWRYKGIWYANKENEGEDIEDLPDSKKYQIVKLPHGPLINIELLDQVQEKLSDTYEKRKRSGIDRVYLLTHILEWEDGSKYYGGCAKNRRYHYYYSKGNGKNIRCEEIEKIVIDRIKEYFHDSPTFKKLVEKAVIQRSEDIPKIDNEIGSIENKLLKLEEENEKLRDHIHDPAQTGKNFFIEWLEKEVGIIQGKKSKLENDLIALRSKRQEVIDSSGLKKLEQTACEFVERFETLTGVEKRSFIERMIAKIVIRKENKIELHVRWSPVTATTEMTESSFRNEYGGELLPHKIFCSIMQNSRILLMFRPFSQSLKSVCSTIYILKKAFQLHKLQASFFAQRTKFQKL